MNDNETLIDQLEKSTGCDNKLASMLLNFTGWDIDGAKRIIEAVPKDIFVVKAKFITQLTGYYGAFFFCYDEKEKTIRRLVAVATNDKEIGKIDVKKNWRAFEEELYNYARTKKVDGFKIDQFKRRLNEKEFVSKISMVLKTGKPIKNDIFNNLLVDELYSNFTDTNIALKFHIEMKDVFEINKGQDTGSIDYEKKSINTEEIDKKLEDKRFKRKDKSLIVLQTDPVLSPVNGVNIKELEFGDEIHVRITDERDIADYLAELLGGKIDSIRVPIFTKIVEIKELEGDNVLVLTQFGPGIMGIFKVPSDVKVVPKEQNEKAGESKKGIKNETNLFFIIGGIVIVIIILIIMIFLSR